MIKFHTGEKWQILQGHRTTFNERYAISNHGRLVKFKKEIKDGSLLKCSMQEGYPIWRTRKKGEYYHALIHRLVARYFLPKPQRNEIIVIHSNYIKTDNHAYNLQWATLQEAAIHQQGSPAVKRLRKLRRENPQQYNAKLSIQNVRQIKKMLSQQKTLKEIALKFGVSDMQIYRIKTGENWKHVK